MQRIICIHFHAKKILINEFGIQEGKNNKKEKDGSGKNNKFGKTMLSFKWVKELRKKTQK